MSVIEMAILGENISLDMSQFGVGQTTGQIIETVVYIGLLYLYIIMALVLLLNLLIAMMGDTYQRTQDIATLEWRIDFARRVLRLECVEVQHDGLALFLLSVTTSTNHGAAQGSGARDEGRVHPGFSARHKGTFVNHHEKPKPWKGRKQIESGAAHGPEKRSPHPELKIPVCM